MNNENVFESGEIILSLEIKVLLSLSFLLQYGRKFDENLTLLKKETRDQIVIFGLFFQETVYCVRNKTFGVSRI